MLCKQCGYYAPEEAIVCPRCGAVMREGTTTGLGAESIRQGRRAREAVKNRSSQKQDEIRRKRRSGASHATIPLSPVKDTRVELPEYFDPMVDNLGGIGEDRTEEKATFERRNAQVYSDETARQAQAAAYAARHAPGAGNRRMVNWFKVGLAVFILVVSVLAGGYFFLKRTDPGQVLMARLGQEASSTALWKVGEEMLDSGDIEGAIQNFEKAKAKDAENDVIDVDGLLLLGNAYEADGRIDDAANLYEEIYTETPSRSEAYVNHIRILLASGAPGSNAKASELMKLAYEKTGDVSFYTQRNDFVPAPPEVDLTAGYYETKKYIAITSYQGFDVYYTFDENAELPAGGILFTERVFLDEGIHTLRAVAVNGELVSNELRGTYRIIMPSPQTPRSSLAPNTYKTRQRVRLKPGLDNENDDDIVIYYTIDGSSPDADSPIFTGEAFWLPGGRVTVKAVAVNKYNKVSNMMEILYKIDIPEPLRGYNYEQDAPKDFTLYVTSMIEFQRLFGEGTLVGNVTMDNLDTECRRYDYAWGYAIMSRTNLGWVVAEVYMNENGPIAAPRNTKIGDAESFVVGKFRDMGQVESPSGNRGLYSSKDGTGKIWLQEDGSKIIRYRCYSADSAHWWQLEYYVNENGTVTAIDMKYDP
ncbi:MAG: chitobiase/beta-hexosaminidase C-terminal domain-containing protein [Clostridia bacterium]|nr:chitobiase/beta-hexosaminidase C-terminal domain-containing protein [Clostridia bacterium]